VSVTFEGREIICVFGSYSAQPGDTLYQQAYEIGCALGKAGYAVANGGYEGVMEASAKGAKDGGSVTIGVTCSTFKTGRGRGPKANRYIDHEIRHDDLLPRIKEMMDMAAGYVVLEGGTGTLTEFGLVWEFVAKRFISARPIFLVGDFWRPIAERIIAARPKCGRHLHFVDRPDQIVEIAAQSVRPSRRRLSLSSRLPLAPSGGDGVGLFEQGETRSPAGRG